MKKVLILALLAGISSVCAMEGKVLGTDQFNYDESRLQLLNVTHAKDGLGKLMNALESKKNCKAHYVQQILQADKQCLALLPYFINSLEGLRYSNQILPNQIHWNTEALSREIAQQFGFSSQLRLPSKFEWKYPRTARVMKKITNPWTYAFFGLGALALYGAQRFGILPSPS